MGCDSEAGCGVTKYCNYHAAAGTEMYQGTDEELVEGPVYTESTVRFVSKYGGTEYVHCIPLRNLVFFNYREIKDVEED